MDKLTLRCGTCGFVAVVDSRSVAMLSGWTFTPAEDGTGEVPCCPACRVDGVCDEPAPET